MSRNAQQAFRMTALAAALLAVYGPASAQTTEGSVSAGVGNWSNDRPRQGMYDGMRDSGAYGLFDADILRRDDATGTRLGLRARSLGLDSREISVDWLRQGNIGFSLEYSRIPFDQPFIYNTGLQGIGTTTLLVPTPSIVPGSGANVELGTHRDRVTATFFKNLAPGFNFNASFRNETKDGTRPWSRGGAAEFAVEPIDSTIRIGEAALNYAGERFQLSGGYYGTWYDNANTMVTTSLTNGTNPFFLSLPLSNQSHEIYLNGGYNFTPTTRATFKGSYSRATQDETLGTFGGLASPLAPTNLDGRIDTTLLEAGLSARPLPKLSIVGTLRYRDFNDKTPVQGIVFSGTTPTVFNTPFSYTTKTGKVEAIYQLPHALSLLGGIEYNAQDRQVPGVGTLWVPFRTSLDEATYRVELRGSVSETVSGSLAYLYSDRDGSAYTPASDPAGEPFQQSINPLNIADRQRNRWRAMLDWSPVDKLGIQFAFEDARDDYRGPNSFGLQDGTGRVYSVDASYQMNEGWQMHGWYTRDENKASEITQNTATITKFNELSEKGDSFGAGVKGVLSTRLKVGADVEQTRSVNRYSQAISGGMLAATSAPTPDITNTLLRFKLFADYAVQKNASLRFNLIYERWSTDDWSWFMLAPTGRTPFAFGTTTDGTSVLSNPKESSTFLGVRYIYRFQ